jgi:predicted outer membrane repeat protein
VGNSAVEVNHEGGEGGAIYLYGSRLTVFISDTIFFDNGAYDFGGAIFASYLCEERREKREVQKEERREKRRGEERREENKIKIRFP